MTGEDVAEISVHGSPARRRAAARARDRRGRAARAAGGVHRARVSLRQDRPRCARGRPRPDRGADAGGGRAPRARRLAGEPVASASGASGSDLLEASAGLARADRLLRRRGRGGRRRPSTRALERGRGELARLAATATRRGGSSRDGCRVAILGRAERREVDALQRPAGSERAIVTEIAGHDARRARGARSISAAFPSRWSTRRACARREDLVERIGVARAREEARARRRPRSTSSTPSAGFSDEDARRSRRRLGGRSRACSSPTRPTGCRGASTPHCAGRAVLLCGLSPDAGARLRATPRGDARRRRSDGGGLRGAGLAAPARPRRAARAAPARADARGARARASPPSTPRRTATPRSTRSRIWSARRRADDVLAHLFSTFCIGK